MQIIDLYNIIKPIESNVQHSLLIAIPDFHYFLWQAIYMSDDRIGEVVLNKRLSMNRKINNNLATNDGRK